ncbi:hypothetical protein MED121_02815 [Marinomonas sp. MED121]|uniref:CHASE domain-containing protein n=1 Tax=Marinomonas sp. MED121 TaxID=314277 RepID=UPI0000690B8A|nr:diguanylate cyclase [Marinomonas sp. MED121]EAQ66108.1 hypothetical protein MED121_02815 [Marinomonas sp. MED121]
MLNTRIAAFIKAKLELKPIAKIIISMPNLDSDLAPSPIWPALMLALFGFSFSIGLFFYYKNNEESRAHDNLEQVMHVQNLRIQAKINQSKAVLHSYFALLSKSDQVSREEYARFSDVILLNHPEIFAVHWAPRVKHQDRPALEKHLKGLDLAPLGIADASPDAGSIDTATIRSEYFPIFYAEPIHKNKKAIGLDPLARPYNSQTIRNAARNGSLDTTQPFKIVQDPDGPLSVAIYQPIYHKWMKAQTPEQRWQALRGYIILMLRPGILLEQYKSEFIHKGIAVRLYDVSEEDPIRIYPKPVADKEDPYLGSHFNIQYSWQVPGRTWMLEFYSTADEEGMHGSYLSHLLLATMLLFTLVLAVFMFNATKQSARLKRANLNLIERQKELDELAYYDQLTHLPNRALLNEHLKRILSLEEREESFSAICVMDLDGFKEINDIYGHDMGDFVLQEVANRLLDKLRDSDVAARIGGDEFVFILTGLHLLEPIDEIISRIIEAISQPIHLTDYDASIYVSVSASVGIALSKSNIHQQTKPSLHSPHGPKHTTAGLNKAESDLLKRKTLIKNADMAMYQAKKQGTGKHVLFQSLN